MHTTHATGLLPVSALQKRLCDASSAHHQRHRHRAPTSCHEYMRTKTRTYTFDRSLTPTFGLASFFLDKSAKRVSLPVGRGCLEV